MPAGTPGAVRLVAVPSATVPRFARPGPLPTSITWLVGTPPPVDVTTQLEKLEGLFQRGSITKDEFEDQKRRLLGE